MGVGHSLGALVKLNHTQSLRLTVYRWARLVASKVLWRAGGRVQSRRSLGTSELWWHAMTLRRFLWRRR